MSAGRPWDFPYGPVVSYARVDPSRWTDVVVATHGPVDPESLRRASGIEGVVVEPLFHRAPLFWTRVRANEPTLAGLESSLRRANVPVRYVASARDASLEVPPSLDWSDAAPARPSDWSARKPLPVDDPDHENRWFLGPTGLSLDRSLCGLGAGTRLAVIDDDAGEVERVDLDAEIVVGEHVPIRVSWHGALLVAWAVGAKTTEGGRFSGVAPAASPRLYVIPKPGGDVLSLPLAIARAVHDGADVVVCATYVEGTTSPMLDDALEFAARAGRNGRGTAVVFPTGRETSSPPGMLHASLSLAFGDPASDPRAFCVGPSGRDGGWFMYRDRKGRLRPFANRGPAVRWLAPGDDIANPFSSEDRLFHAESSGASALAAGVLLLVLACNPSLRLAELDRLLRLSVDPVEPHFEQGSNLLADPADVLPAWRDPDGHNAKHGYGRLNASRACVAASDPLALTLVSIGEGGPASAWTRRRHASGARAPYSRRFARWGVRALLSDARAYHAARAVARHARLVAGSPVRYGHHGPGALIRQLAVWARMLRAVRPAPTPRVRSELEHIERLLAAHIGDDALDRALLEQVSALWAPDAPSPKEVPRSSARFA